MKLKHAQQELKARQAEVKKMDSGYKKDQDSFEAVKKQKEKLENDMKKLNYEGILGLPKSKDDNCCGGRGKNVPDEEGARESVK